MSEETQPARGNAFFLLLLLLNMVVSLSVGLLYGELADTEYGIIFISPWFTLAGEIICFLLPLALWIKAGNTNVLKNIPNTKLGRINVIFILALGLCLQPVMMLLSALTSVFFPNDVSSALSGMHRYPLAVTLTAVAVMPAFCEEIVFRGYILSQYGRVDIKKAALVNGLFFAMIHLNLQQFLYAFVMGVIFTYFVYYTRSIRAGVLAHFLSNGLQVILSYVLDLLYPAEGAAVITGEPGIGDMWGTVSYMAAIALIFLPAVVILSRAFITHNRQRNIRRDMHTAFTGDGLPASYTEDKSTPRPAVFGPAFWGGAAVYGVFIVLVWPW